MSTVLNARERSRKIRTWIWGQGGHCVWQEGVYRDNGVGADYNGLRSGWEKRK